MSTPRVQLGGLLGNALDANHAGRLSSFITDESSPAIALFHPQRVAKNNEGDWYGEHAGKWLYAAARAAWRTGDATLAANVRRVADYLVGVQDADGYLGTYAPTRRFMVKQEPGVRTWDGAPGKRTWDIWTHSYLILGLLEVNRHVPNPIYVEAARKIGELCWRTLTVGGIDVTALGNHHGMSATVLLDPAVELFLATADARYLDLARLILKQADDRAELQLLSRALAGADAADIGTGKSYQLCWNLVGIVKLFRVTGETGLLDAVRKVWENIRSHHLTLGGGPWGGVAQRSREVFNPASVFSPYGYVETCATLSWIQLNCELLKLTGEARFAEQIECAAYNDLLGALAPNGEDWCYYSFPNGRRVHTTYWRCCKSSGAMALEELPAIAYTRTAENNISVNLYGPSRAAVAIPDAGSVTLEQVTHYPFDGGIRIRVNPEFSARFSILVRIPAWTDQPTVRVNGADVAQPATPGTFVALERNWHLDDEIVLQFPMAPVTHRQSSRSVQEARTPNGDPISQEVMRFDHVAVTRGPLVYATGLIDGFKMEETIRVPEVGDAALLEVLDTPFGHEGPAIRMNLEGRAPLTFVPYYEAGGRMDGAWRLTWLQLAPVK